MFIFSAMTTAKPGQQRAAADYMTQMRSTVEDATGRKVWAWRAISGAPVGTFAISTRLDSASDLLDGFSKLGASDEYAAMSEGAGDLFVGPSETNMTRIVGATDGAEEVKPIVQMTAATIAGSFTDAITFGHEVLDFVHRVTGNPGALAMSETNIGEMTWLFGSDSPEAADDADGKLQADPGYLSLYDKAAGLFVPGGGRRGMIVQL